MKSGYKIVWTDHALSELEETYDYIESYWTEKELHNLSNEIERTLQLISKNPKIFQKSKLSNAVRRTVIMKYNSLYYRINNDSVEILSFFSNRKNPNKLEL